MIAGAGLAAGEGDAGAIWAGWPVAVVAVFDLIHDASVPVSQADDVAAVVQAAVEWSEGAPDLADSGRDHDMAPARKGEVVGESELNAPGERPP